VHVPATVDRGRHLDASFRDLRQCYYASRELAAAKDLGNCKVYEGNPAFEKTYADCLNGWMDVRNRSVAAEAVMAGCGDVRDVDRRYFEATREAAKQGVADAQLCYLQSEFGSDDTSPVTDADVAEYQSVAPRYVDEGFKRGDWRIAYLLTRRQFHPGSGPVTGLDKIGQPVTIYKMTKLLRLGASGVYAKALDSTLNDLMQPGLRPEAGLRAVELQEADTWAYETYVNFFSGVPGLTEAPVICSRPQSP
jgi:hypothetical protein